MATKKTSERREASKVDPSFLPLIDAFTGKRDLSFGKLMSCYGLKVNGKIFAMFGRGGFVAKLPRQRVDELVQRGKGERFAPGHGRLMKEWVAMRGERAAWIELAEEAYEFVKSGKT